MKQTNPFYRIATVIFLAFLLVVAHDSAYATHLRAGEIIVERVDCSGLSFRIRIIVYTDSEPGDPVLFGDGLLNFGDGSDPLRLPTNIQNNTKVIMNTDGTLSQEPLDGSNLGPGVSVAIFEVIHVYSSPGIYKIGYVEPNRNQGILNIDVSVQTTFYVETQISIDGFLGCNNTPVFLIPPIDRACPGVAFFHNPGAYDPDGDSLSFEIVVPKQDLGANVNGYLAPNAAGFYTNYPQGNETLDGPPEFTINPLTGEVTWNSPGGVGEYNIAFIVKEYRKIGGVYYPLGFVTRDMQIIVEDCNNKRPELIVPEDICVEAGETINKTIFGTDPNNDQVKIEAFSQVFDFGATVSPLNNFQPSNPPAELNFTWETDCPDIREQPYQVVFKITDNPSDGPRLVSFAAWNITVVGPKPDLTTATQEGQGIRLNWGDYPCKNESAIIQVWRRVDSNPYLADDCETGIRENAGYQMIRQLPINATTFLDNNLAAAAKYCYRLVVVFPFPKGGESIVSDEVCLEFVPAEDPVITHVSVTVTDDADGEIVIGWREPFDLDEGIYPHPYTYRIIRADGFSGDNNLTLVGQRIVNAATTDTLAFTDTGINTLNQLYNYRIELVIPGGPGGGDPISSAVASSVWLDATPQFEQIELRWQADVPWSNVIPDPPGSLHHVFRGPEGSTDDELVLIDSVNVTTYGFVYVDSGQYMNMPLEKDQLYCYKVMAKGTYGNPAIETPQNNFSQTLCVQPRDSIAPCAPEISISGFNCEDFLATSSCDFNDFRNEISWEVNFSNPDCQNDIRFYQIYYASGMNKKYTLLAEVIGNSFVHENLNSFKGCYKVKAIDRSGNESEFSNEFCVDNCPYYELPNIFTPGNGDDCNEYFSAYSDSNVTNEDGSPAGCGTVDITKCARFVLAVDFTVYNRWGKAVYHYQAKTGDEPVRGNLRPELINWDGIDDNGQELSSGVYYYLARVTFDVVDPGRAVQDIKGWVQIVR